ncbi:MAG: hypothetical protein HFE97_03190 [Oscillospiraceae bacterium]|nr:hypothetical protein [Oscillospiraceae bacterium]
MSIRSLKRDNKTLDQIVCYFMETVIHRQVSGVEDLPLENPLEEPFRSFLDAAMEAALSASGPTLTRLILEAEYSAAVSWGVMTAEETLNLQVIKELAWHSYYDLDPYGYLLETENLWGNDALIYAARTFYPTLPEEIRTQYQIPAQTPSQSFH